MPPKYAASPLPTPLLCTNSRVPCGEVSKHGWSPSCGLTPGKACRLRSEPDRHSPWHAWSSCGVQQNSVSWWLSYLLFYWWNKANDTTMPRNHFPPPSTEDLQPQLSCTAFRSPGMAGKIPISRTSLTQTQCSSQRKATSHRTVRVEALPAKLKK